MSENNNFSIQGFNLVTLLKRLEAATSRLEDVTVYHEQNVATMAYPNGNSSPITQSTDAAPVITSAPVTAPVSTPSPIVDELPKSIKEFDLFIDEKINTYVEQSNKIDSILGEQAEVFKNAILKERNLLLAASKSKKIALDDINFQNSVIMPINELIMKVIQIKDDNRSSKNFNYLNAVAEGVAVLGWIVTSTPVSYIPDFKDSAQFWTNRVLKDNKGTDNEENATNWVKSFLTIFDDLKNYVKEYQTTGIAFNGSEDFETAFKSVNSTESSTPISTSSVSSGGAPPPPPPPPPPPADLFAEEKANNAVAASSSSTSTSGMGAVFAELNKGESITSGLKKVDKSEMTHKNPELRKKSVPMPPKKPKNLSSGNSKEDVNVDKVVKTKKTPQNELVDNKWMITNVTKQDITDNNNGMIIIEGEMDQSVYIGNCEGIVVQIKGKVNAISVNICNKVGIVIEKAISSVELTKSNKCEIQVIDNVPIINVDQCESTNIYLSESAINVELYSSCCTALNVNVPDKTNEDGDLKELAISEQFVTRFTNDGRQTTEPVHHG